MNIIIDKLQLYYGFKTGIHSLSALFNRRKSNNYMLIELQAKSQ